MDEDLVSVVPVSDEANSSRSSEASVFAYSPRMLLAGDGPQAKKADCRPSASPITHPWIRNAEQEVTFYLAPVTVAGAVRQPSAKVTFDLSRTSSERYTKMQLRVIRADVGVRLSCTRNCFGAGNESCRKSCTIVLIHKMDIRVTPRFGAEQCQRLEVSPDHKPQQFTFERSSNQGCLVPLCSLRPAVTFEHGTTVGRKDRAHGWGPSSRVDASKEAFFRWKIRFDDNGSKFEFNRMRFGTRPPLPINPSDTQISPRKDSAVKAVWSLKPELEPGPVQFEVRVTLYTAVSKRLFPFYNVIMGPPSTSTGLLTFTD